MYSCVLLVAATCSVQAAASELLVELSYDRVKFVCPLAAHSRSDLAPHVHEALYSCGIRIISRGGRSFSGCLASKYTQSASLDGLRAVEKRVICGLST